MRKINSGVMKRFNLMQVVRTVQRRGPISRTALAEQLGLTVATVTNLSNGLVEAGILCQAGHDSTGALGRRAVMVDVNPCAFYSLGVEMNNCSLVVGLADTHSWEGAASVAGNGIPFIPNIPTEEVFTAPHRLHVDGVVKGTKPYVYNGQLIEGFSVTFKDGKVVAHSAEKNDAYKARLDNVQNPVVFFFLRLVDYQRLRFSHALYACFRA